MLGQAHNIAVLSLPGDISASKRYWGENAIDPPVEVFPRSATSSPLASTTPS